MVSPTCGAKWPPRPNHARGRRAKTVLTSRLGRRRLLSLDTGLSSTTGPTTVIVTQTSRDFGGNSVCRADMIERPAPVLDVHHHASRQGPFEAATTSSSTCATCVPSPVRALRWPSGRDLGDLRARGVTPSRPCLLWEFVRSPAGGASPGYRHQWGRHPLLVARRRDERRSDGPLSGGRGG